VALFAINCGFRRLYISCRARLNLDEAQHILIPADQINFTMKPCRTVIPRNHHITFAAKVEIGVFFSAPASAEMCRAFGIPIGRNPIDCSKSKLGKAAGKHCSKLPERTANSL
jgi:hypothetical protein